MAQQPTAGIDPTESAHLTGLESATPVGNSSIGPIPNQHAQRRLVESSLRLLAAIWIGSGLVLLLVTIYVVTAPSLDRLILLAFMAVAMAVSAVVLLRGRHPGEMVAVMTAAALVSVLLTAPSSDGIFSLSVQWAALAALSAAFLLNSRYSIWVVIAITVGAQALATLRLTQLGELSVGPFVIGVNNVGMGVGAALAVRVWRKLADEGDELTMEADEARVSLEIAQQRREYLRRFRNGLHDTVMNTVGVIARGVPVDVEPQLRRRVADDLAQMDARIAGADSVADLVLAARRRAASLGLTADVRFVGEADGHVPQYARDAMSDCVSEALLNVSKHATGPVSVLVSESSSRLRVTVVDSGSGLAAPPRRLADRAEPDQIDVQVEDAAVGAIIRLTWVDPASSPSASPRVDHRDLQLDHQPDPSLLLRQLAFHIGVWIGGAYLLSTLIGTLGRWEPALMLRMIGVALVAFAVVSGRWIRPSAVVSIVLLAGIPLVSLPIGDVCDTFGIFPSADWAALVAIMLMLLSTRAWRMTAILAYMITNSVVAVYLFTTATCGANFAANVVTNTFALFAVILFLHKIDRFYSAVAVEQRQAASAKLTAAAVQSDVYERRLNSRAVLAPSGRLLRAISDGSLALDDPHVRAVAAAEECFLRSVDRITPELGLLAQQLLAVMNLAREKSLRVDVDVVGTPSESESVDTVTKVGAALNAIVTDCAAINGGALRIVVYDGATAWLSVVADSQVLPAEVVRRRLSEFEIEYEVHDLDGQTLTQFGGPEESDA